MKMNKTTKTMKMMKMMKKMKMTKSKRNMKKMKNRGGNDDADNVIPPPPISHVENILCEILSRLPVKSLMRFKSVCKHWRYLIQQDPYFIYLHFTRSKTQQPGLFLLSLAEKRRLLFSADLFEDRAAVHTKDSLTFDRFEGPVNGLICIFRREPLAVRIYNLSTQEVTPWIENKEEEEHGIVCQHAELYFQIGFDPATKGHKVICVYDLHRLKCLPERKLISNVKMCKVLTVGQNSWRRIEVPPYRLTGTSAYVNGSIYWRAVVPHEWNSTLKKPEIIVAFDVGIEKFRVIPIPNFIQAQRPPQSLLNGRHNDLLEVDGRLALLHVMLDRRVKLWIYDDDHNKGENSTSTVSGNWTEEVIALPYPLMGSFSCLFIKAIASTNQMCIHYSDSPADYIFLYDRKKKTSKELEISGIPSSRNCGQRYLVEPFVKSIFPVQKPLQRHYTRSPLGE